MNRFATTGMLAVFFLSCFSAARAQDAPSVRAGTLEIGGFAGASYGLDKLRVMGGGNVSYGVKKWLLPYVEFSYFPGIAREYKVTQGIANQDVAYNVPMEDFHGGVHLRAPIKGSKVVPYGVFGFGLLHSSFNGTAKFTVNNNPPTFAPFQQASTDAAVNFGGGLRYYTNEKLGFRLEAKAYRPVSGPFSNFVGKFEVGIFYQVR
jgi:hypothetical protein